MKFAGAGNPAGLSPYGQSSTCTARSTAPTLLACSAAQSNAALLDGESSSPTTISFLIPHLHSVGRHHYTSDNGGALLRVQPPLVVLSEDLRPSHPTPSTYAYVLLAGEHQSGLRTDVCVTLGSSMLPNHPVG